MNSRSAADESPLPMYTVDAFTSEPFKGNPAAVCLIPYGRELSKELKQNIAREMKHSQTAFVSILREGDTFEKSSRFALQWFAPEMEVAICGHGTVATSAVLFNIYNNPSSVLEFETLSGPLHTKRLPGQKIELDLPAYTAEPVDIKKYEGVIKATVGSLPVQEAALALGTELLIRLQDTVTRCTKTTPPFPWYPGRTAPLAPPLARHCVLVTLKGRSDCVDADGRPYDFVSRYFAPWIGVQEDFVCGSAHSVLCPFWSKVLNKNEFYVRMCSARPGDLDIRVLEDRVRIGGRAYIVLRGHISVL